MTHTPNIANFVEPILQQSGLQYVFISSDDCSAVVELEKLLPKYHVVTPCRNVTTGHISSENPRKEHDHLSVLQVTLLPTYLLTHSLIYLLTSLLPRLKCLEMVSILSDYSTRIWSA